MEIVRRYYEAYAQGSLIRSPQGTGWATSPIWRGGAFASRPPGVDPPRRDRGSVAETQRRPRSTNGCRSDLLPIRTSRRSRVGPSGRRTSPVLWLCKTTASAGGRKPKGLNRRGRVREASPPPVVVRGRGCESTLCAHGRSVSSAPVNFAAEELSVSPTLRGLTSSASSGARATQAGS